MSSRRKRLLAETVEEQKDRPSLMSKLREALDTYSPEGKNPDEEMHAHIAEIIRRIEHERAREKRARAIRRRKRKAQKAARKLNRR